MEKSVYISIGTNKGDKISNCKFVIKKISSIFKVLRVSSIYKTQSWGFDSDFFLNFIIEINTNLNPLELLEKLIEIEKLMGRVRENKLSKNTYESRVIDLDILFYGNKIINKKSLIIPHPKLYYRNFILVPLFELNPFLTCPLTNKNIGEIILNCKDKCAVEKTPYVVNFNN